MKDREPHDIAAWVSQSSTEQCELRQAVHTALATFAQDAQLRAGMIMKGGPCGSGDFLHGITMGKMSHAGSRIQEQKRAQFSQSLPSRSQ